MINILLSSIGGNLMSFKKDADLLEKLVEMSMMSEMARDFEVFYILHSFEEKFYSTLIYLLDEAECGHYIHSADELDNTGDQNPALLAGVIHMLDVLSICQVDVDKEVIIFNKSSDISRTLIKSHFSDKLKEYKASNDANDSCSKEHDDAMDADIEDVLSELLNRRNHLW